MVVGKVYEASRLLSPFEEEFIHVHLQVQRCHSKKGELELFAGECQMITQQALILTLAPPSGPPLPALRTWSETNERTPPASRAARPGRSRGAREPEGKPCAALSLPGSL